MVEKPHGFIPVVLASASEVPKEKTFSRLELERISKRIQLEDGMASAQLNPIRTELKLDPVPNLEDVIRPSLKSEHKPLVCQRCFGLTNYGSIPSLKTDSNDRPVLKLTSEDNIFLKNTVTENTLAVMVVDLVDLSNTFLSDIYSLLPLGHKHPILLVGNKIDLFPGHGSSTIQSVTSYLQSISDNLNIFDTLLISAKTGFNVDAVHRKILEYVNQYKASVLLVGKTNVGKSRLFNTFKTNHELVKATVSPLHGTTIGILKKKLANVFPRSNPALKSLWLCDLPGLEYGTNDLVQSHFTPEQASEVVVKTKIEPIRHSLKSGESGLLGDFLRIDVDATGKEKDGGVMQMQFFTKASLPYVRKPTALMDLEAHSLMKVALEFDVNPNSSDVVKDVVIGGGIGWISFGSIPSSMTRVKIWTPGGVGVSVRNPIRSNFL